MSNENTNRIVKNVRKHFDHDAAKQLLKEKYEAKMLFAAFGGMWKASPDLIAFLSIYNDKEQDPVLIDEYGNPCKVNAEELFNLAAERWQEQMNAWHAEYEQIQNKR